MTKYSQTPLQGDYIKFLEEKLKASIKDINGDEINAELKSALQRSKQKTEEIFELSNQIQNNSDNTKK